MGGEADEVLDVAERDPPLRAAVMAGWRRRLAGLMQRRRAASLPRGLWSALG